MASRGVLVTFLLLACVLCTAIKSDDDSDSRKTVHELDLHLELKRQEKPQIEKLKWTSWQHSQRHDNRFDLIPERKRLRLQPTTTENPAASMSTTAQSGNVQIAFRWFRGFRGLKFTSKSKRQKKMVVSEVADGNKEAINLRRPYDIKLKSKGPKTVLQKIDGYDVIPIKQKTCLLTADQKFCAAIQQFQIVGERKNGTLRKHKGGGGKKRYYLKKLVWKF